MQTYLLVTPDVGPGYKYPTLDALYTDIDNQCDPDDYIEVYMLSAKPREFDDDDAGEPPTPDSQYNVGQGAWQTFVWEGTAKNHPITELEQYIINASTSALGNRLHQ